MNARSRVFLLFIVTIAVMIYLPAFVTRYGFHSDYSLLLPDESGRKIFVQWDILAKSGRILGGVVASLQAILTYKIAHLALWRLGSFLLMLGGVIAVGRYLVRSFGMSPFWAGVFSLSVMTLPSVQLHILWVLDFFPGTVCFLLAFGTYLLVERGLAFPPGADLRRPRVQLWPLLAGVGLFLVTLFIYPPTAMAVFVFTFARVIFSRPSSWPSDRMRVARDLVVFGAGMLLYFLINWYFVTLPLSKQGANFTEAQGTVYKVSMAANLLAKGPLLGETFAVAAAGTWHLLWGMWGVVAALILAGAPLVVADLRGKAGFLSQAFLAAAAVFLIANAPALLSQGCFHLLGYRVLTAGAVMLLLCQVRGLELASHSLARRDRRNIQRLGIVVALVLALTAARNVYDSVRNFSREMDTVLARVASLDMGKTRRIIAVALPEEKGQSLIDRDLPYEFSYMMTSIDHFQPVLREALDARGQDNIEFIFVADHRPEDLAYFDESVSILDLNESRPVVTDPPYHRERVFLSISRVDDPPSIVARNVSPTSVLFTFFQTVRGQPSKFWEMGPAVPAPWFEIDFQGGPRRLDKIQLLGLRLAGGQSAAPDCRIESSEDGGLWTPVPSQSFSRDLPDVKETFVQVLSQDKHRRYRILFHKNSPADALVLQSMYVIFE